MNERITIRGFDYIAAADKREVYETVKTATLAKTLDKLQAYEDAEADNRLIILPCKMGSEIYRISKGAESGVVKDRVIQFSWPATSPEMFVVLVGNRAIFLDDFGKTVFLTREAALEKAGGAG